MKLILSLIGIVLVIIGICIAIQSFFLMKNAEFSQMMWIQAGMIIAIIGGVILIFS